MKALGLVEPPHLGVDLKTLRLPTVLEHWERQAQEALRARRTPPEYLADLMHLEVHHRREKRIRRLIQEARFPVLKTLDSFDFNAQAGLQRDTLVDLAQGHFVASHENVLLIGGVGTGKSHLAIALGVSCCQHERRVRYFTAAELTNDLVEAKQQGRLSRRMEYLARFDVVVLDELGYVPFDKQGADLLFGLVSKVYERKSLIVTTNLPFARWSEVFLDPTAAAAVIDRIVHHATILKTEGESYRLRSAQGARRKPRTDEKHS